MLTKNLKTSAVKARLGYTRIGVAEAEKRATALFVRGPDPMLASAEGDREASVNISMPSADGTGGVHIVGENLSAAWVAATDALMQPGVHAIEPLVVTLTGFDGDNRPLEVPGVSALIDAALRSLQDDVGMKKGKKQRPPALSVGTVASTMFPESIWNPAAPRANLYSAYKKMLPRLKRHRRNERGLYFERLIAYGSGPENGNQLEHMIRAFESGVKRISAYQAPIVKPETDSTSEPYGVFPCLQQIAVLPSASKRTLAITGFYGTQYLFERGYGNFLGLSRIGRFLAHEMGLKLTRVTCVASHATAGDFGKERGRKLVAAAKAACGDK